MKKDVKATSHAQTLSEIAALTGTTKSTVSRVLSNSPLISDKTRERVLKVIEQQHYRPNLFARALAGGKTGLIGVISSNIGSGFYAEVIRGIDLVYNRAGKRLLVSFAHFEADYAAVWRDIVTGGRVEGVVVIAPTSDFFKLDLDTSHVPLVICAGNPPRSSHQWNMVDRVGMNNEHVMDEIIGHLSAQGCRTVLHAAGWSNNSDAVERRLAFGKAVRKYKLDGRLEYFGIIQSDGRGAMEKYLAATPSLPDAIVCFNDSIALGILEAWHARAGQDTRVPFALTGWDDSPAAAAIGLTSVTIPFSNLGEESARLLNQRIENPGANTPGSRHKVKLSVAYRSSSRITAATNRDT